MIGWPVSLMWAVACLPGELSQQPMWPQLWHIRRCTQLHPLRQALLAAGDLGGQVEVLDRRGCGCRRPCFDSVDDGRAPASDRRRSSSLGTVSVETGGEPITEEGIEALREEIAELEGPRRERDGGADQGRARGRRPQGERRVPHRQGGPGAPRDPDQAPARTAATTPSWSRSTRDAEDLRLRPHRRGPRRSESGKVNTWTLVGSTEADLAEGRLSAESPIGRALLNAKLGKPVKVETPRGARTFVVQKLVG